MCNHYKPGDDPEAFEVAVMEMLARVLTEPRKEQTDMWPKRDAPIVYLREDGPVLDRMRWGVAVSIRGKTSYVTNARNDKLLSSFTWKFAVRERRCLIPARGYFEPGTGPTGARGELYFTLKNRPRFYFAGLWDTDRDELGTRAFAMVTTEPNAYAARFHDRMPVVLSDADAKVWLGDKALPDDQLLALCRPLPDDVMQHSEISATPREKKITKADLKQDDGGLLF